MTQKSELGKFGEDTACEYLLEKGYKIIGRNFRKPWGEIDIIAKAPDKTLIFFEIKTMRKNEGGIQPEDQMTRNKISRLKKIAVYYAALNQNLINERAGWRIDLLTLTDDVNNCVINHYENI